MTLPALYDWIGGEAALKALVVDSCKRVRIDPLLAPVFGRMDADHPAHVAASIGEGFGGPPGCSDNHGGHAKMIRGTRLAVMTSQVGADVVENALLPKWGWGWPGGPGGP